MDNETVFIYIFTVSVAFYIVGVISGKIFGSDTPRERKEKNDDEDSRTIQGRIGKVDIKMPPDEYYNDKSYAPTDQINKGDRFYTIMWKSLKIWLKSKKKGVRFVSEDEIYG